MSISPILQDGPPGDEADHLRISPTAHICISNSARVELQPVARLNETATDSRIAMPRDRARMGHDRALSVIEQAGQQDDCAGEGERGNGGQENALLDDDGDQSSFRSISLGKEKLARNLAQCKLASALRTISRDEQSDVDPALPQRQHAVGRVDAHQLVHV